MGNQPIRHPIEQPRNLRNRHQTVKQPSQFTRSTKSIYSKGKKDSKEIQRKRTELNKDVQKSVTTPRQYLNNRETVDSLISNKRQGRRHSQTKIKDQKTTSTQGNMLKNQLSTSSKPNHSLERFNNTMISNGSNSNDSQSYVEQMLEKRDQVDSLDNSLVLQNYYQHRTTIHTQETVEDSSNFEESKNDLSLSQSQQNEQNNSSKNLSKNHKMSRFARKMQFIMDSSTKSRTESTSSKGTSSKNYTEESNEQEKQEYIESFNQRFGEIDETIFPPMKYEIDNQQQETEILQNSEEICALHDYNNDYKMSVLRISDQSLNITQIQNEKYKQQQQEKPKQKEEESVPVYQEESAYLKGKSDRDHRLNLMKKLTQNKFIEPTKDRSPNHQSVIIFDWDDTLMSSSFLSPFQSQILQENVRKKLPKHVIQQLDILEQKVIKLLKMSLKIGPTLIITNAGNGWVELSSMRFLPKLYKQLIHNAHAKGLRIISARSMFEKELPNGFKEWKMRAFLKVADQMNQNLITNIVAIGDSQIELDAANHLAEHFVEACIKTVKLKEQPNLLELTKQVELIYNTFDDIVNSGKNLTIRLQKVAPEQEQQTQEQIEQNEESKSQSNLQIDKN